MGVMSYGQFGEMICHYILHPLLVFDLDINSWSRRIHLISLALASCLVNRYFKVEWSIKITMNDPTKYALNLSKALTTASSSFL